MIGLRMVFVAMISFTVVQSKLVPGDESATVNAESNGSVGFPYWSTWQAPPAFFTKEFERRGLPPTSGQGIFLDAPSEDTKDFVAKGLQPEDIVIRLNGIHLKDQDSYAQALASLHAGRPAKASIKRVNAARTKWEMKIVEIIPVDKGKIAAILDAKKRAKAAAEEEEKKRFLAKEFTLAKGGTITGEEMEAWNAERQGELLKFVTQLDRSDGFRFDMALADFNAVKVSVATGDKRRLKSNMQTIIEGPRRAGDITWLIDSTPVGGLVLGCDDGRALHYREVWVEALRESTK